MKNSKKEVTLENSVDFFNFCSGINELPIYEIICERFTRLFRVSLSNWIRMISTVEYSNEIETFGDWVKKVESPSSMCIFRLNKLCGPIVVSFDQRLAYGIIDAILGGNGKEFDLDNKEFTQIELSLMKDIFDLLSSDLSSAFDPVAQIGTQYIRQEINPQFIGVVPPSSKVIVSTFKTSFENVESEFQIAVPYSTLFPIRNSLFRSV